MPRRLLLRRLANNWKLKLAALALAVLLWAVVSAEQLTTQWIPIPVEVSLRDPAYVQVEGPSPDEVSVRFTGSGRELWELALNRPVLVLEVREVGAGRVYVIDPRMVRIPNGLTTVSAQDVRPGTVRLRFERVSSREVPVRVRVGRETERRWVLADSFRVEPARVRVRGAAEAVARVASVLTRPLEVPPGDTLFRLRVRLDTAGLEGLRPSVSSVEVSGRVETRAERALPGVRVTPPGGMLVNPGEAEVRVEGGTGALRGLDPARLRVTVAAPGSPRAPMPPGGWEAPLRVQGLPPGTTARVSPARVRLVPLPGSRPVPSADSAPASTADTSAKGMR